MSARQADFRAIVEPTAWGGWSIRIEEYWISTGGLRMRSEALYDTHLVDTYATRSTRKGAERKARRLIARHRKVADRLARQSFEVGGESDD